MVTQSCPFCLPLIYQFVEHLLQPGTMETPGLEQWARQAKFLLLWRLQSSDRGKQLAKFAHIYKLLAEEIVKGEKMGWRAKDAQDWALKSSDV